MAKNKLPIAVSNPMPKEDKNHERKWRAEDALRDLERAELHKCDKDLMKDVKALAKTKAKALNKI